MQQVASSTGRAKRVAGRAPSEDEARILGTKTGIRLLTFAVLVQWIPLVEYLGLIMAAIGIFHVIRGRRSFGLWHERLLWCSIVLFVGAGVSAFALNNSFTNAVAVMWYSNLGPAEPGIALTTYEGLAEASMIIAGQIGLAFLLLAYGLNDRTGRRMLLAALVVQVVVSVAVFVFILSPYLARVVPPAFGSDPPDAGMMQAVAARSRGSAPCGCSARLPLGSLLGPMIARAGGLSEGKSLRGKRPASGLQYRFASRSE